jgi:hypothetical protein
MEVSQLFTGALLYLDDIWVGMRDFILKIWQVITKTKTTAANKQKHVVGR